jgi:hypothetical protein
MVHCRPGGALALKPVVEVNVRLTMGRLAWEWMKRMGNTPGHLRLLRKATISNDEIESLKKGPGLILNDPDHAQHFLALWRGELPGEREEWTSP